jgi:hypothetical protein
MCCMRELQMVGQREERDDARGECPKERGTRSRRARCIDRQDVDRYAYDGEVVSTYHLPTAPHMYPAALRLSAIVVSFKGSPPTASEEKTPLLTAPPMNPIPDRTLWRPVIIAARDGLHTWNAEYHDVNTCRVRKRGWAGRWGYGRSGGGSVTWESMITCKQV